MRYAGCLVLAVALGFGCGKSESPEASEAAASSKKKNQKRSYTKDEVTRAAIAGFKATYTDEELEQHASRYVPAEFKRGKGMWRDAGLYVDGKPRGMFWFGELPTTLKPVWVEEIEGLDFNPGDPGPRERVVKVRRYRFSEYFEAVGVDLDAIKEVHFYGPHSIILPLTGEEFRRVADIFYFRFGGSTEGKPIAVVPKDVGKNFDRLNGVAIYIDEKPPKIVGDGFASLDGEPVDGIPYFGDPLRGGIRVYKDNRLATVIKRNQLNYKKLGTKGEDGAWRFRLFEVLEAQGVDTSDIRQLEVIADERRAERFDRAQIETMVFHSSSQAKGQILLDEETPANALALFTEELPVRTAEYIPPDALLME